MVGRASAYWARRKSAASIQLTEADRLEGMHRLLDGWKGRLRKCIAAKGATIH